MFSDAEDIRVQKVKYLSDRWAQLPDILRQDWKAFVDGVVRVTERLSGDADEQAFDAVLDQLTAGFRQYRTVQQFLAQREEPGTRLPGESKASAPPVSNRVILELREKAFQSQVNDAKPPSQSDTTKQNEPPKHG